MDIILNFFKEYWTQLLFFGSLLIGFYKFSKAMIEATKCSLRNDILDIYDRCKNEKEISKYHQVISITHLAQIAAKGDFNYFIHKEVEGKKTNTKIEELTEDDLIKELARIATGEINNISIVHAKELRSKKVA